MTRKPRVDRSPEVKRQIVQEGIKSGYCSRRSQASQAGREDNQPQRRSLRTNSSKCALKSTNCAGKATPPR